jgi:hypothetical protein
MIFLFFSELIKNTKLKKLYSGALHYTCYKNPSFNYQNLYYIYERPKFFAKLKIFFEFNLNLL